MVALYDGLPPAPHSALGRENDPDSWWGPAEELLAKIAELIDMGHRGTMYEQPIEIARPGYVARHAASPKPSGLQSVPDVPTMLRNKLGGPPGRPKQ